MASREEWRPVPGFTAYEVTESGRIRNKYIGELISRDGTVTLQRGGTRYHRSVAKLAREAFIERHQPVIDRPGFRAIPGFPGYSMNKRTEQVYNERLGIFLKRNLNTDTVVLALDGKQVKRTIRGLLYLTFGI